MAGQHLTNYLDVVRVVNMLQTASLRSMAFFPTKARDFSFQRIHTSSGAHLAFSSLVTGAVSSWVKWPDREADHSSFV